MYYPSLVLSIDSRYWEMGDGEQGAGRGWNGPDRERFAAEPSQPASSETATVPGAPAGGGGDPAGRLSAGQWARLRPRLAAGRLRRRARARSRCKAPAVPFAAIAAHMRGPGLAGPGQQARSRSPDHRAAARALPGLRRSWPAGW